MLIPISYSGSYGHSAPGSTVYQAILLMHGSGDMISVTNFWSRLWGWSPVSLLFQHISFHIDHEGVSMVLDGSVSAEL